MNRSRLRISLALVLLCSTLGVLGSAQQGAAQQSETSVLEQCKFTLHKFEQAIGEETCEIRRDGDSVVAKIDFKFTDRGNAVPLSTTFRAAQDWTPQDFEIKGKTARPVSIDQSVSIKDGAIAVRNRDKQAPDIALPKGSF